MWRCTVFLKNYGAIIVTLQLQHQAGQINRQHFYVVFDLFHEIRAFFYSHSISLNLPHGLQLTLCTYKYVYFFILLLQNFVIWDFFTSTFFLSGKRILQTVKQQLCKISGLQGGDFSGHNFVGFYTQQFHTMILIFWRYKLLPVSGIKESVASC